MEMIIQIPMNSSLFSNPHCFTKSALEKNFNAKANSINPKTTFTTVSHPPDFGKALSKLGKMANRAKGMPRPIPKPDMAGVMSFELEILPKTKPSTGPVQENDTMAKVSAIKKIPLILPILLFSSTLLAIEAGKLIS